MRIVDWPKRMVYPLGNFVRRIKGHMYSIYITVGMAMIPSALALLVWAYDHEMSGVAVFVACLLGIVGFVAWWKAVDLARADDKNKELVYTQLLNQMQTLTNEMRILINETKGLRSDLKPKNDSKEQLDGK